MAQKIAPPHRDIRPFTLADLECEFYSRVTWRHADRRPLMAWIEEQEQEELLWLAMRQDLPAGHVLEIGCGWAASTFMLAMGNQHRNETLGETNEFWTYDPLYTADAPFRREWIFRSLEGTQTVNHFVWGISDQVKSLAGPIRLAFVDGDHVAEWACRDVENIVPGLAAGGLLMIHDVCAGDMGACDYGPTVAWDYAQKLGLKPAYIIGRSGILVKQ